jgi:adenylate cyclase
MHGHYSIPRRPDRAFLRRLLSDRNQFPDRVAEIDHILQRAFERTVAMLVLDMCGFSRLTIKYGIMHYLAMIEEMAAAAAPAVIGNGGTLIKIEADNLYAVFPTPELALEGALDIFRAFDAVNSVVPPERDIHGSIGIGFGPSLIIENQDLFGAEMNFACKLGEDVAAANEILLTRAAYQTIPTEKYLLEPVPCAISGLCIDAWRFKARLFEKVQPTT